MEKLNKLSLPATILIGCLILGGFYYASQINKQKSIEKQQKDDLGIKKEQEARDYVARQKSACLGIYEAEGKKYNNVSSWRYVDLTDKCEITYNETKKKTVAQCEEGLNASKEVYKPDPVPPYAFSLYLHCLDGTFIKEF